MINKITPYRVFARSVTGFVFMTFLDATRAVPMQIQEVNKRIIRETPRSNRQRLSKKYQETARENPKLKRMANRAAVNPINPNSKRVTA